MKYRSKLKSPEVDELFAAIRSLKNEEECYRFFEDLSTINEIQAMAQRWHVARLLNEKRKYKEIEEITGASTATISRINKCLQYGADGYQTALHRK